MSKNRLSSSEKALADACYCQICGAELEQGSAGAVCPRYQFEKCTNGKILTDIGAKHFKALKRVKRLREQDIDSHTRSRYLT